MKIVVIPEVDSTNSWLARNAASIAETTLVAAHEQTAGRGQRGNTWEAEPGANLTFSVLWRPTDFAPARQFAISEAFALAIADTLADLYGIEARVKWPNDIYVGDRKLCGILIEHAVIGRRIERTIAGAGININQTVFRSPAPNPVSVAQITGREHSLSEALEAVAAAIDRRFAVLEAEGPGERLHTEFMSRMWRADGHPHPFREPDGEPFSAVIEGVESDGMLRLRDTAGRLRRYAFKQVEFLLS